jgi:Mrp family chromosome partitioning ATPase
MEADREDDLSAYDGGDGDLVEPEHRAAESALGAYLRAVTAHWVVFAVVTLASVGAAVAWLALRSSEYEATARVLVSPVAQDDSTFIGVQVIRDSANDPTRTVQTAATLVQSREAAIQAAQRLGPQWSPDEVGNAVSVQTEGESNVLAIRAKASDPTEAARVANEYAQAALSLRDEAVRSEIDQLVPRLRAQLRALGETTSGPALDLASRINQLQAARGEGDPTLSVSEPAPPGIAIGPRRSLVLLLSLVAGLALGAAAAILLELLGRRVRDADEATNLFPVPILARVPKLSPATQSGVSDGSLPFDRGLQEAVRSVFLQLNEGREGSRAVMLTSASTGDGKTTSAICLALTMARAGHSVILMDCDLRWPNVGRMLGLDVNGRSPSATPDAALADLLVPVRELPLSVLSVGSARTAPNKMEELISRLPYLVAEARPKADFIVIDTAPLGEVSDALPLLREVDDVIVVTRPRHTQRASYEVMRDLIVRTGAIARGLLVVGETRYVPYADTRPPVARPGTHSRRSPLKRVQGR